MWTSRRALLIMQHRNGHPMHQPLEVWQAFQLLFLENRMKISLNVASGRSFHWVLE